MSCELIFLPDINKKCIYNTFLFASQKACFSICKFFLVGIVFVLFYSSAIAEGTKELQPSSSDFGFIQIFDRGRVFATYNSPVVNRLNVHICNAGEDIYFGFKQPDNDVFFRLKDPAGNVVVNSQSIPTSGAGYISTYNQAVAGPSQIVGAGGYNAMSYKSLVAGDYYFEFNTGSATTLPTNPANGNAQRIFDFFDITVANGTVIKSGRLWSQNWDINTKAGTNPFTAKMYILSTDSIITSIDFNGMQPFGAAISANSTGLSNTGNLIADRASKVGDYTLPEYKIFLNDPDNACFPTGVFGNISAPTVVTGCDPANRCINITVNKAGKTEIVLDLNGVTGYQPNTVDRLIIADVVKGSNCVTWDSKDGLGNIITTADDIILEVNYLNGVTHLPLYDVEHNPDGYIVELVRPAGGKPSLYWDDAAITTGTATDGKVNLTGCSNAAGCHRWRSRGNNNSAETINTWWYPNIVKDELTFQLPDIYADGDDRNDAALLNDSLVCESIPSFQLSGKVTNSTGGSWTGGSGVFTPSRNALNAVYVPTAAERSAGSVKIYLTPSPVGICPVKRDSIRIQFEKAPIVKVGKDTVICSTNTVISLSATLTNATTGIWTGGNGTFAAPANRNSDYTFGAADNGLAGIDLIFTTTGIRLCKQEDDTIHISYGQPASIEAGLPINVCESIPSFLLNGEDITSSGTIWVGGAGVFTPSRNVLNPTYEPTAAERSSGSIKIYLTPTTVSASCPIKKDSVLIEFEKAPIVKVGKDTVICSSNATISVSALLTNAAAGIWKGGNGVFTNPANQNSVYTFNAADIAAGGIDLIFTTTGIRLCDQEDDTIHVSYSQPPVIDAGSPIAICGGKDFELLASTGDNTSTYQWTGGSGIFSDDAQLTPTYTFSASEKNVTATKTIQLTLTATKGSCPAVTDILTISVYPLPKVQAGNDTVICRNIDFTLSGNSAATSAYKWYSLPANTLISTQQTAQLLSVVSTGLYVFEATDVNQCSNTDTISVDVYDLPTLNPGSSYCFEPGLILNANPTFLPSVSYTYSWIKNNAVIESGTANSTFSVPTPGNYILRFKTAGCSKDAEIIVHAKPILISPDSLFTCDGNTITLETTPRAGSAYEWFRQSGSSIHIGNTALITPNLIPNKYYVVETDLNGCTGKDSVIAFSSPLPVLSLTDASICADSDASFDAAPSNISGAALSSVRYEWKYQNTVISTNKIVRAAAQGTYSVTVSLGNCRVDKTVDLSVHPLPVSSLQPEYIACFDNSFQLELNAGAAQSYQWVATNETAQSIQVQDPGIYEVVLKNQFQCETKAKTLVKEVCKPSIFVSNAFSPNGDNINDFYTIFEKHVVNYSMTVFNRWGEVIFLSQDRTVFWDGTYKGERMPLGVYPYIIKYEGDSEEYKGPYTLEGSVTLVK